MNHEVHDIGRNKRVYVARQDDGRLIEAIQYIESADRRTTLARTTDEDELALWGVQ